MPKPPPLGPKSDADEPPLDQTLTTGFYEASDEPAPSPDSPSETPLAATQGPEPHWADDSQPGMPRPRHEPPPGEEPPHVVKHGAPIVKVVAVVLALTLVVGGVLIVRRQRQQRALREGLQRATELMRLDTHAGYSAAADLLKSLVPIDPMQAGSLRAFALGMLVSDYREEARAPEAEVLLVEPERAPAVPPAANLARAALLLSREAGTATTFAARARGNPWVGALQARVALLAGNLPVAAELVDGALAIDPQFPQALAVKGDVLRRRKDHAGARAAYLAVLRASPTHPRAVYGMAKLALSGKAAREQATPPLQQLLSDSATPANERARAALHLAALRGRAGDRSGAAAAMAAAPVPPGARPWLEKAAAAEELSRTGYHAVEGAPAALQSASDDDPPEPILAQPPVEKPAAAKAAPAKHAKAKAKASKSAKSSKKATVAKSAKKTAKKKPVKKPPPSQQ